MKYESWISYRYLTAAKDRFLSIINLISIAGIAIGVMALIVVIGVMTGFDQELRDKIIGTNAHILIEKETGILKMEEGKIVNLTTAASIWFAAGIGMLIGYGWYLASLFAILFAVLVPRLPRMPGKDHTQE